MTATEPNPPTKGWLTSEFLLAVVGVIALVVLVVHGDIEGSWAAPAIAFATFGYAASRALVKKAQIDGDATLSSFKADLALIAAQPAVEPPAVEPSKPARPAARKAVR